MGPFLCLLSGFSHRSPSLTKPQSCNPSLWTAPACRHAPCFSLSRLADLTIPRLQHPIPTHWQSLSTKQNMLQSLQNRHSAGQAGFKTAQYGTRRVLLYSLSRQRCAMPFHQTAFCCAATPARCAQKLIQMAKLLSCNASKSD